VKVSVILTVLIVLMMSRPSDAQTDPCSIEALTSSFQSAALSNEVQTWIDRYELSTCSANVIQGARQMARGYSTITSSDVTAGSAISTFWRGMGVHRDGSGYVEVAVEFSSLQNGDFEGEMILNGRNESTRYTIDGSYVESESEVRDTRIWDRLLDDWGGEDVLFWLTWRRVSVLEGNPSMDALAVAVIKANGEMRYTIYDPTENNQLISEGILIAQTS